MSVFEISDIQYSVCHIYCRHDQSVLQQNGYSYVAFWYFLFLFNTFFPSERILEFCEENNTHEIIYLLKKVKKKRVKKSKKKKKSPRLNSRAQVMQILHMTKSQQDLCFGLPALSHSCCFWKIQPDPQNIHCPPLLSCAATAFRSSDFKQFLAH